MASVSKAVVLAVTQASVARQLIELARQIDPSVQLEIVRHGEQALERIHALQPALVIADTGLPVIGGIALLQQIRKTPALAQCTVILLAERPDAALVRSAAAFSPRALLTLPLDTLRMLKLLHEHLLVDQALPDTLELEPFLDLQRERVGALDGLQSLREAVARCLSVEPKQRLLQQLCQSDWPLHERLQERASEVAGYGCQSVESIIAQLGLAHCFNLALEFELERAGQLPEVRLSERLEPYVHNAKRSAQLAAWLARQLRMDPAGCYLAGLLLNVGEFALAHSLQMWLSGQRGLSEAEIKIAFELNAASFGSALRIAWRLPIPLREAIAGFYGLRPGVLSREALLMNLTAQLRALGDLSPLNLSEERAVRMLGVTPAMLQAIPSYLLAEC